MTSAVMEMSRLVRYAASPAVPGEKVPHAIARAARRLGFDRGRVESFWYGKARAATAEEMETARRVAVAHTKDLELLRHEYRRAVDILARLETRLAVTDPGSAVSLAPSLRDMVGREAGPGGSEGLTPDASDDGGVE